MKYITMKDELGGVWPFIFSERLTHSEQVDYARHAIADETNGIMSEPYSAGFFDPATGTCHGSSESLGIDSNPADTGRVALGMSVSMMTDNEVLTLHHAWVLKQKEDG